MLARTRIKQIVNTKDKDILSLLSDIMNPSGYSLEDKLNNRRQRWPKIRATLFTIELIFNLMVSFIPSKYPEYLLIFGDYAYYLIGNHREAANLASLCYRLFMVANQWMFVLDDLEWLKKANQKFKEIDTIHMTGKMKRLASRSRIINSIVGYFFACLMSVSIAANPLIRRELYWENIPRILFGICLQPVAIKLLAFYGGVFVVNLFLLLEMSSVWSRQFNRNFKEKLQKGDSKVLVDCLNQYWTLYSMLQYLNVGLKKLYLICVGSVFGISFIFYYLANLDGISPMVKVVVLAAFSTLILIVMYISTIAGRVNEECERMSEHLYKQLAIRKRFSLDDLDTKLNVST